jgi:hypothetical protein
LNHQDTKRTKISRRFWLLFGITEVVLHRPGSIYTNSHFREPNNYLVFLVPWW